MAKTKEGIVQAYCMAELKKRGCLVRKISYEMRRGCPDLIAFVPTQWKWESDEEPADAKVIFIEVKKDGDTQPEEHQIREHERIRQHGGFVWVIGSKAQMDELIGELKL